MATANAAPITTLIAAPCSYGPYVVVPPGVPASGIEDLAAPVENRLRFAGEATSRHHSGYVHGAMLSGIREARAMIRELSA